MRPPSPVGRELTGCPSSRSTSARVAPDAQARESGKEPLVAISARGKAQPEVAMAIASRSVQARSNMARSLPSAQIARRPGPNYGSTTRAHATPHRPHRTASLPSIHLGLWLRGCRPLCRGALRWLLLEGHDAVIRPVGDGNPRGLPSRQFDWDPDNVPCSTRDHRQVRVDICPSVWGAPLKPAEF